MTDHETAEAAERVRAAIDKIAALLPNGLSEGTRVGGMRVSDILRLVEHYDTSKSDDDLMWRSYLGLGVLRTMLRKAGLSLGVQTTDELTADIGARHPEFAGRSAMRSPDPPQPDEQETQE